jgi:hypothetical protein
VALCALAAILLFWGLDSQYLWQDEANTAVLAVRMLRFGRPLAYDGVNLISTDNKLREEAGRVGQRTRSAKASIDFHVKQGDFKPDTTWKWHPWGQFIVAAASIKLLGQTTLAARLPFALAGVVTVLVLYRLTLTNFGSAAMAQIASLLLVFNSYWIIHGRQCRYYSLSSLFLVVTLLAYARWQRGGRWGAAAFVAAAWCWFQVDFGSLWPVLAVLFADGFVAHWRRPRNILAVWTAFAATIAPFVWYYELWGRSETHDSLWTDRMWITLFNTNEYVVAAPIVAAAVILLIWRRKSAGTIEYRVAAIGCGIIFAMVFWVPTIDISPFLRYEIMIAPVTCMVSAWVLTRIFRGRAAGLAWVATAVMVVTPWLSMPLHPIVWPPYWYQRGTLVRDELFRLKREMLGQRPDLNRQVIEWLRYTAPSTAEILINYEDLPLMYYLPNPIRGGLASFRVEDESKGPPEFLVVRDGIPFTQWGIFLREARHYLWDKEELGIEPAMWGNNPDPMSYLKPYSGATVITARLARQR